MTRRIELALLVLAAACATDRDGPGMDPSADGGMEPTDTAPPDTAITTAPGELAARALATFAFSSDDAEAGFECRIDDGAPVRCSSPFARELEDGEHAFSVQAIDRAGNRDATPATHRWTIDSIYPETVLTAAPPRQDTSATARFEFRASEDPVAFECALDEPSFRPCTSPVAAGPLGDGTHLFRVRARDRAGNVEFTPVDHVWEIDTAGASPR